MTNDTLPPMLTMELASSEAGHVLTVRGPLTGDMLTDKWSDASASVRDAGPGDLVVDMEGAGEVDGAGLGFLARIKAVTMERGGEFSVRGLTPGLARMLDSVGPDDLRDLKEKEGGEFAPVSGVGRMGREFVRDAARLVSFVGECATALVHALTHPHKVRWPDVALCCEKVGAGGLPIIILIGTLMGLIMAFQSVVTLQRFGGEVFTAKLLGLSMVRELGPLVTAILLAGRSGAAFAAEIGTMTVNDEINALKTMGISPMRFLVTGRVLASAAMTPLLTMFFIFFSFVGGAFVMLPLGYPLGVYTDGLVSSIQNKDLAGCLAKALVFSVLVAGIGCYRGMRTRSGASAVGDSTTSAVVSGLVLIAVADGVFAVIYYALGI